MSGGQSGASPRDPRPRSGCPACAGMTGRARNKPPPDGGKLTVASRPPHDRDRARQAPFHPRARGDPEKPQRKGRPIEASPAPASFEQRANNFLPISECLATIVVRSEWRPHSPIPLWPGLSRPFHVSSGDIRRGSGTHRPSPQLTPILETDPVLAPNPLKSPAGCQNSHAARLARRPPAAYSHARTAYADWFRRVSL